VIVLVAFAVAIPWRSSPEAFARILRRHGVDPTAVTDVEAAWRAFGEFLQVEIDGIDTTPDSDADGFIVQWGRYSWNDKRPSLSFTRQLAVAGSGDDPELWQIDLVMCFDDLHGLDSLNTGFVFDLAGPPLSAALAEVRAEMERYPQLQAVWRMIPVSSDLSFEPAC
jgi:hypothetical protein